VFGDGDDALDYPSDGIPEIKGRHTERDATRPPTDDLTPPVGGRRRIVHGWRR
jgi:hypothetical protein